MGLDLFEEDAERPDDLEKMVNDLDFELECGDRGAMEISKDYLQKAEALGYTFDIRFDGFPHSLRTKT